ncbi:hypothetical protein GIB67_038522 [Kingdonia uniflora]|uniref:Uncharacterized protein n=1 Tax=Kingdonia uniflora TaxID=39325 RepID=A0A7J7NPB1_9MAGN|nr:hypothetical protein GIB67_038522 [Kingdonia uniflora]
MSDDEIYEIFHLVIEYGGEWDEPCKSGYGVSQYNGGSCFVLTVPVNISFVELLGLIVTRIGDEHGPDNNAIVRGRFTFKQKKNESKMIRYVCKERPSYPCGKNATLNRNANAIWVAKEIENLIRDASITPMQISDIVYRSFGPTKDIIPPPLLRAAGKPRTLRRREAYEVNGVVRQPRRCSKCQAFGHNNKTCKGQPAKKPGMGRGGAKAYRLDTEFMTLSTRGRKRVKERGTGRGKGRTSEPSQPPQPSTLHTSQPSQPQ